MILKDKKSISITLNYFYFQADINGLKWCKYIGNPCSVDSPLDDPVLVSFSTALENNVLCSWRHASPLVSQKLNQGLTCSENPKELWLFWYGVDPRSINIVDKHLKGREISLSAALQIIFSNMLVMMTRRYHIPTIKQSSPNSTGSYVTSRPSLNP